MLYLSRVFVQRHHHGLLFPFLFYVLDIQTLNAVDIPKLAELPEIEYQLGL
jgi:hypothetical protein